MALAVSPLSQVCKGIRNHLDAEINRTSAGIGGPGGGHGHAPAVGFSKVNVVIDTPTVTAGANDIDTAHYLNLFFFRFEPAGLFPDTLPGETGWLRSFCLITPFAFKEDSVGNGEGDLKLIGEVIRIFHEKPVFRLKVDGEDYHLQVIFQPLPLDQLNQLWSTQGDTVYHPSVLFEVSLAPVLPAVRAVPAPLTGGFGLEVQPERQSGTATVAARAPEVPVMAPAGQHEDWTPAICFVRDGTCAFSFSLALGSPQLLGGGGQPAFLPQVWLAGKPGEAVGLRWETWDAASGWQKVEPADSALVTDLRIDPEAAAAATLIPLTLPFNNHVGQLLLYAERSYTRASDGVVLSRRSNPLLISLYAA